jgi:hypothetical protein
MFQQALNARKGREGAAVELRLRSFLVSDRISPVVTKSLADFNVVPVESEAKTFFEYLSSIVGEFPDRESVLRSASPKHAAVLGVGGLSKADNEGLKAFFDAFERVDVADAPKNVRSAFLLGAAPTWEDLALGLDAQREITAQAQTTIEDLLENSTLTLVAAVLGHRGAGKSTLLMRVALNSAAAGHLCFFAFGEDLPPARTIARAIDLLDRRVALFIDDAEWVSSELDSYLKEFAGLKKPPLVVVALRANMLHALPETVQPYHQFWVSDLSDPDIDAVIDVLERNKLLGAMTGKPRDVVRREFKVRANKQLLVAMREVTTGENFAGIMKRELTDIADPELQVVYLTACLASAASASLSRQQLLASSELAPARLLSALARELRLMLVQVAGHDDRWTARHQVVAEAVVEGAPKHLLGKAYRRILSVLAHDMDREARSGDGRRWFKLFLRLINHTTIYRRFEKNVNEARAIYDSLGNVLARDHHYWLQYGSLELNYGELDFAAPYIASAESIEGDDPAVRNTKGHLLLALGRSAKSLAEAISLREEGSAILNDLIVERGSKNPYPWHTLIAHSLDWLEVWTSGEELRSELESFRRMVADACEFHPTSDLLKDLRERVELAYLRTALPDPRH